MRYTAEEKRKRETGTAIKPKKGIEHTDTRETKIKQVKNAYRTQLYRRKQINKGNRKKKKKTNEHT